MALDFSTLPPPNIIEVLDNEAIVNALVADIVVRFAAAGVQYDVGNLEVDPVKIVLEAAAARETLLRARINDAAKANLVVFATGSDLDHLAAFYDVTRLSGETDAALQSRIILAIQARSPGGSKYWYEAAARRADVRIRDVAVYREDFLPIIHVAVLSSENGGIPDQTMLGAVQAEVTADDVRLINDKIVVETAVAQSVHVGADVWLLPDAPLSVFDALEQRLRDAWVEEMSIGFDLDVSWIQAKLHAPGVKRVKVTEPTASVVAAANEALAIGTVSLRNQGRAF
jgi:phage-related baseplate assembly protein